MVKSALDMPDSDATCERKQRWLVTSFCVLAIATGHTLEVLRGKGWTAQAFPDHWEYVYLFADTTVAIAFAVLVCWVAWFTRRAVWSFGLIVALGFLNWFENELKSRAFFGGFLRTYDWWQWAAIDASTVTLVALLFKPAVNRVVAPRPMLARHFSIADLFLATLASAVLVFATRHIATLPFSPDTPNVLFCGWPLTIRSVALATLVGSIGASAVCLVVTDRLRLAVALYAAAWIGYQGTSHTLVTASSITPQLTFAPFKLANWWFTLADPMLPVCLMFVLAMLAIRWKTRPRPALTCSEGIATS